MPDTKDNSTGTIAANELKLLIERIERIEEKQRALAADKKDVYQEAKARGYEPRAMRAVVAIRKLERSVYQERKAVTDTYLAALGIDD